MANPTTTRRPRRQHNSPEGPMNMGASRDLTTAATRAQRSGTAVLDRAPSRASAQTRVAPPRGLTTPTPLRRPVEDDRVQPSPRRLGSRQVVSVRGRRTQPIKAVGLLPKVSAIAIVMLIGGIVIAMWLSGIATQQTFRINSLVAQESQLSNQLETLNRDLEHVSSSAELARRAREMGMVVPDQPGILTVEENGDITENRASDGIVSPMLDVNGDPARPGQASSDPKETGELSGDNLPAVPQGEQLPAAGVAPYSSGTTPAAPVAPAAPIASAAPAAPAAQVAPGAPAAPALN